mmetsp:Transcript_11180/g.20233  ORF Transcript_11180/g.20233 Transcript_11180/m.20233 type:complete len:179 (+) Transcript_11180:103-639(+)
MPGSNTVFVTVGTTEFNALIKVIDSAAFLRVIKQRGYNKLVIQKGKGTYWPEYLLGKKLGSTQSGRKDEINIECFDFAPTLGAIMKSSDLIISHAGSGSIFESLTLNRPLIVVPNPILMDNHQVELGEQLEEMGHLVCTLLERLIQTVEDFEPSKLVPYQASDVKKMTKAIDSYFGIN